PFKTQLANASGLATNYSPSPCGKSLLDYLCLTGASTFGCTENPNPNSDACTRLAWQSPNIVDSLVDAGLTWKAYMENMTSDCGSPAGTAMSSDTIRSHTTATSSRMRRGAPAA